MDICDSTAVLDVAIRRSGVSPYYTWDPPSGKVPSWVWFCEKRPRSEPGARSASPNTKPLDPQPAEMPIDVQSACSEGKKVICASESPPRPFLGGRPPVSSLCVVSPSVTIVSTGLGPRAFPRFEALHVFAHGPADAVFPGYWKMDSRACRTDQAWLPDHGITLPENECRTELESLFAGKNIGASADLYCSRRYSPPARQAQILAIERLARCLEAYPSLRRELPSQVPSPVPTPRPIFARPESSPSPNPSPSPSPDPLSP